MTRDDNSLVPKRTRGKRRADSSASTSASKRKKSSANEQYDIELSQRSSVQPNNVISHSSVPLPQVSGNRELISSNGTVATLPSREESILIKPRHELLGCPPSVSTAPGNKKTKQTNQVVKLSETRNSGNPPHKKKLCPPIAKTMRTDKTDNDPSICEDGHCSRTSSALPQFSKLFLLGIIILFIHDGSVNRLLPAIRQHSTDENEGNLTLPTLKRMTRVAHDNDFARASSHHSTTPPLRHLLELDDYERQQSLLSETERKLAQALAELANSRHDVVAARAETNHVQDAYSSISSQLEQAQVELTNTRRDLELALRDLAQTRDGVELLARQLDEAYEYIDELYRLLETQEMVATNALNFVATAAVKRQQEAAAETTSCQRLSAPVSAEASKAEATS